MSDSDSIEQLRAEPEKVREQEEIERRCAEARAEAKQLAE